MFSASSAKAGDYAATDYIAGPPGRRIVIHVGVRSRDVERLMARFGARTAAFVTAANPRSGTRAIHANRHAEAALADGLRRLGLPCVRGLGQGQNTDWPPERSLLVFRVNERLANHIARRYGQNAIVFLRRGRPARLVHLR